MSKIILFVLLGLTIACGSAPERLYYDATTMKHKEVARTPRASLLMTARNIVGERKVYLRHRSKTYRRVVAAQVNRLPPVALWAMYVTQDKRFIGAEADMRIWYKGKKRIPVSVRIDMTGVIKIDVGDGRKAPRKKAKRGPRFINGNATWTSTTKDVVREAFELLNTQEYAVVKKLPFRRDTRSSDKRKSAQYVQKNCTADIRVYNSAFNTDHWQFVGSAQKTRRSSVRTVMHEIGHALERRASLVAFCRYKRTHEKLNRRIKKFNRSRKKSSREAAAIRKEKERLDVMVKRIEDLTENSPIIREYRKVAHQGASPTVYGETSEHESFAESFSLFRTDPAALGRVLPKVLAWFERGQHLKAMRQN